MRLRKKETEMKIRQKRDSVQNVNKQRNGWTKKRFEIEVEVNKEMIR